MAKAQDPTYEGGDAPGVEPFTENRVDVPEGRKPVTEPPAQGWNPYRGQEAHGVRIDGGQDVSEDVIEEEYRDAGEVETWSVKDQPPISVVEGWTSEVLQRIMAATVQIPLPQDTWVKVLEDNPRRTSVRWWVDPAPQGSNPLSLSTDPDNKIIGLVPFMLGGGINNQPNVNYFTNELWLYSASIARTFHCIEEYRVKA